MSGTRQKEILAAALIGCGGLFLAMVPGASSSENTVFELPTMDAPLAQINVGDFSDVEPASLSASSRAVAAQVMSGEGQATRLARTRVPEDSLTPPSGVQFNPRASAASGPAWSGRAVGLDVSYSPTGATYRHWWLVGGAGRESYAVAPAGLREFTIAPVAAETTIGDAHLGVAFALNENAYASVGYVRENRKFTLGTEDWEEDEHYLGVGVQARW
jgi:hypothetical protein